MHVHTIKISFLREKQPVQYEKSQPAVEFVATVEDHEDDHATLARKLMQDAAGIVYAGLGLEVPARVAAMLAAGEVPEGGAVEVTKEPEVEVPAVEAANDNVPAAEPANDNIPAEAADVPATAVEPEKKKRRGRPKGSKNTQPKAGTNGAAAPADAGPDIPGDDPAPNISADPENRVNPEDNTPDIPETVVAEAAPVDSAVTALELKAYLTELNQGRKMAVATIKQVLASHGVARCEDLPAEKVQGVYNQFVEMVGA